MWFAMVHGRDRLRARWGFSRTNFSQVCISKHTGEQLDEERCRDERVREEIVRVVRSNPQDVPVQVRLF